MKQPPHCGPTKIRLYHTKMSLPRICAPLAQWTTREYFYVVTQANNSACTVWGTWRITAEIGGKQGRQCAQARSLNKCCRGKAISITHSERASVVLVIEHAMRMRRIILSSVASLLPPYSSTLPINGTIFGGEKVLEHKMFFFIFSTTFI